MESKALNGNHIFKVNRVEVENCQDFYYHVLFTCWLIYLFVCSFSFLYIAFFICLFSDLFISSPVCLFVCLPIFFLCLPACLVVSLLA